jgi:hypothetical protein
MSLVFRKPSATAGAALVVFGLSAMPALAQAPQQLYNKTIQINWSVTVVEEGGRAAPVSVSHTVYVSSTGRLFHRGSRAHNKKGRKQMENAPGAARNSDGEATGMRLSGNRLVGQTAFAQGARQFVATFDPSFSSCTVAVTFGREAGGLKRVGVDGKMVAIQSMTASGESCSIREGNPFAN